MRMTKWDGGQRPDIETPVLIEFRSGEVDIFERVDMLNWIKRDGLTAIVGYRSL